MAELHEDHGLDSVLNRGIRPLSHARLLAFELIVQPTLLSGVGVRRWLVSALIISTSQERSSNPGPLARGSSFTSHRRSSTGWPSGETGKRAVLRKQYPAGSTPASATNSLE